MRQVLVGSVYGPDSRNAAWYRLQRRYLSETLGDDFTHVVWACRTDPSGFDLVLGRSDEVHASAADELADGYNRLLDHFMADSAHADYLFLAPDAFPFRPNWLAKLRELMRANDFLPERNWAAVVKAEQFDVSPNPAVVFVRGPFLHAMAGCRDDVGFSASPCVNLLGFACTDAVCGFPCRVNNQHVWQPLMRSNVWSPHPTVASVYGGLFYHHGAGVRVLDQRAVAFGSFDHVVPRFAHATIEERLFREVSMNPALFLSQIGG